VLPPDTREIGIIYIGEEPGNIHIFRVIDENDAEVAHHSVQFNLVGSNIPIVDPIGNVPRETFISDYEGYIRIKLLPNVPAESVVNITATPTDGNSQNFQVNVTYILELTASPLQLEYLVAENVTFSLSLNGVPLAPGTYTHLLATEGDFNGLPLSQTVDSLGKITLPALAALKAGLLNPVRARVENIASNSVNFTSVANGNFELEANKDSLEFLESTEVVFSFTYEGIPLPEGMPVELFTSNPEKVQGLPSGAVTGPGGRVVVQSLTALVPEGPLSIQGRVGGRTTNAVSFNVSQNGTLSLSASPDTLNLYSPETVEFTLEYDGTPLPPGLNVRFNVDNTEISGIGGNYVTASGGRVDILGVEALVPVGPLEVKAVWGEKVSNSVFFEVNVYDWALAMDITLDPNLNMSIEGSNPGHYLKACQTFAITLSFSYLNKALVNFPLTIWGLGFQDNGSPLQTDSFGEIKSSIFYSAADRTWYTSHPDYLITLGNTEIHLPGPVPLNFIACN
jgi:hypothetical protein